MKLDVLYADNHLLAVEKLAGEPVVPDETGDRSLLERAKEWLARERAKPGAVFVGVVHRLDRPVSGVVLFACTSKAAARLSEQFRVRSARKLYFGVSERAPREPQGELEQWLVKDERSNTVRAVAVGTSGAQRALTRWRVAGRAEHGYQLDLEPLTGRPHQLRVACSALGAPLLGDLKYGDPAGLPDRSLALHAAQLEIEHPTLREPRVLRCLPPAAPWWNWRRERGWA